MARGGRAARRGVVAAGSWWMGTRLTAAANRPVPAPADLAGEAVRSGEAGSAGPGPAVAAGEAGARGGGPAAFDPGRSAQHAGASAAAAARRTLGSPVRPAGS